MNTTPHVPECAPFKYEDLIHYREGHIAKLSLVQTKGVNMTLLAFDAQKGLPPHHAPGQTLVQVLDGRALFRIAGKEITLEKGETLLIPAGISHAVMAQERFKMLLTAILPES